MEFRGIVSLQFSALILTPYHRIRNLEASCAEKDAVLEVLQRRNSIALRQMAAHSRRTSEPVRRSQLSIDGTALSQSGASEEGLHMETWQV